MARRKIREGRGTDEREWRTRDARIPRLSQETDEGQSRGMVPARWPLGARGGDGQRGSRFFRTWRFRRRRATVEELVGVLLFPGVYTLTPEGRSDGGTVDSQKVVVVDGSGTAATENTTVRF